MNNIARTIVVIMAVVLVTSAGASDLVISYPEGWTSTGVPPHATSPIGSAIVVYDYDYETDPYQVFDRSLVIQARPGGETYETEFDGKIFGVKYSADGEHLLVHQNGAADLGSGEIRAHLLDNEGTVLWSKPVTRGPFFFSTTGEAIYSWWDDGGTSVEVFDLAGASVKVVELDSNEIQGVVVPGTGAEVIFVTTRSILCLGGQQSVSTEWRTDLPSGYPNAFDSVVIDPERFVVYLERKASIVVNVDGTLEYTYDPVALAAGSLTMSVDDYAAYRMFAGPSTGTVTLFDGSSITYTLDLATGELTPRPINTSHSLGYKLAEDFREQTLFIVSPASGIARTAD